MKNYKIAYYVPAILVLVLSIGVNSLTAQVCTPAPINLISSYSGDGNALDARSRNNGSMDNGATFAAGQVGQAFSFDGGDDQVTIPHNENQNTGSGLTIEGWINSTGLTHGGTIIQKRTSGNVGGFVLEPTQPSGGAPNGLGFYIYPSSGGGYAQMNPANVLTAGVWQHVAATFDGAFMRIYVNGAEVANQPSVITINSTNAPIIIGRNAVNGTGFNGKIDEIAVYNRALSASEIQSIYNSGTAGKCKPIATNAPDNQIVWMAGDGDTSNLTGNTGGGALSPNGASYTVGKVGQAFRLDGANGYVNVGTPPDSSQNFTIEGWIRRASSSVVTNHPNLATPAGLIYSYGFGGYGFLIDQPTNKLALSRIGVSQANSNSLTITDTNWHHVAVTKVGSTMTFYLDGTADTVTYNETFQFNSPAFIGRRGDGVPENEFFGDVDEISQYSRPLTAVEIQSIANAGLAGKYKVQGSVPANIAAWYPGDGNTNDLQSANNGALQGGATYAPGKVGQAFSLNGTNAYVSAPSTAANDPTGTANGASMEAWVYFNQLPSAAGHQFYIVSKNGANPNEGFDIHVDTDNYFKVIWGNSYLGFPNFQVQTGVWYHVVATFSTTAGVRFYANSVLLGVSNVFTPRAPSSQPLTVGHETPVSGSNTFFNGLIDEPAIYNRALSEAEIRDQYYAGSLGKYKAATNPTVSSKTKTGDAEVTFASLTAAGAVQAMPLNGGLFPALPVTNTGLVYDISTTVSGSNPTVCFKLPSFTTGQFAGLRIYHLESGVWVNRTAPVNSYPNLCSSGLTSLSPFAIGFSTATAASASVGGRVTFQKRGLSNATVMISGGSLAQPILTKTGSFGYYKFDNLPVGETYFLTVFSKRYVFTQPTQIVNLFEDVTNADFMGEIP